MHFRLRNSLSFIKGLVILPPFRGMVFLALMMSTAVLYSGAGVNSNECRYGLQALDISSDSVSEPLYIYEPVVRFGIPEKISESSGLIIFNGGLWSHNDSGGEAEIYKMDTVSGEVVQTIRIRDGKNTDCEEIEQDEQFIYIGDFGNNFGNRRDLKIYRIHKKDIPATRDATVDAAVISFRFDDQDSFEPKNRANDYDCESMICYNGQIYLFSKNWVDYRTRVYKLTTEPGDQVAEVIGEFNFTGLATAAAINETGTRLVILGYKDYCPLMWIFTGFTGDDFFGGNKIKVAFPYNCWDQTEAVTFIDSVQVFISSELSKTDPQVFHLDTRRWNADPDIGDNYPEMSQNWAYTILEKKKKSIKVLNVDVTNFRTLNIRIQLTDANDNDVTPVDYHFDKHVGKTYVGFDIKHLAAGEYTIRIISGHSVSKNDIIIK
jgi:hypothetical protein